MSNTIVNRDDTEARSSPRAGWVLPDPSQTRPWYFYAFVVAITVIGAGLAASVALVVFFGLVAGF